MRRNMTTRNNGSFLLRATAVPEVRLRARISYGILSVCPSVCLSVTTRYGFKARWDRDSGSSAYDSHRVSSFLWGNLVPLGNEIPLERRHQRGVPSPTPAEIVILPLLAHLAWKRLLIDTDLLLIITSTADKLCSGSNIDDLERPWTPKILVFSEFLAILGCNTHFKSELRRNHSRQTRTTCVWNVRHWSRFQRCKDWPP